MLEVDDIVPSPLTPLVLAPTVPEPVCEMQTPDLFAVAQSSPQPRSVDTANYARVNHCLHPPLLPQVQVNVTYKSIVIRVHPQSLQDRKARHKSTRATSGKQSGVTATPTIFNCAHSSPHNTTINSAYAHFILG